MKKYETNILLLSVVLCWAAAYVFIETISAVLSPFGYLTLVNGIAAIILNLVFFQRILRITRKEFLHSMILGAIMLSVLLAEYAGVKRTNSSTASLLASLDLVVVPFLLIFLGKVPKKNQITGIFLILVGTVLSYKIPDSGNHIAGAFFMALDGVLMAFYNVFSNRFCEKDDPVILAAVQLLFMAAVSMVLWYREDPAVFFGVAWTTELISAVLVLGIFSKAFAYIALMYGEHYADPIDVVVIFALEPVITMVFAAFFPNEFGGAEAKITRTGLVCAAVIVAGSIIAGLEQEELRELRRRLRSFLRHKCNTDEGSSDLSETEAPALLNASAEIAALQQVRIWSHLHVRLKIFFAFLLLGGCFKIMVLIPVYTEIRPVNGLPVPIGLLFGLQGAIACSLGNLAADFFGTLTPSSVLGMLINFLQAFIPYRLWMLYGKGRPDVHSFRNLAAYIFLTFASALSCAWFLGFGSVVFFHEWIPGLVKYVFLNNMFFPLFFGLPLFIILTSPDVALFPEPALPWILPFSRSVRRGIFTVHLLIVAVFTVPAILGGTPVTAGSTLFTGAFVPAVLLLGAALL